MLAGISGDILVSSTLTESFKNVQPQNPEIDETYVVQERRTTDFKALEL